MKCELYTDWQSLNEEVLNRWDIYFTDSYLRLNLEGTDQAKCFSFSKNGEKYLFPYILSSIPGTSYFDFKTPYGYGGPVSTTSDDDFVRAATQEFINHFDSNVVTGLVRFHPLLANHRWMVSNQVRLSTDKQTVAMSLEGDEEGLMMRLHAKHRNSIRAAQKENLTTVVDYELAGLEHFQSRYYSMLDAMKTSKFYYFSNDYFSQLKKNFNGQSFLLTLKNEQNKDLAMALILQSANLAHYHLAVVESDCEVVGVGNLLVFEAARVMQKAGKQWFHLGGGRTNSEEDSLFKFKKRFSSSYFPFYVGEAIINENGYNELVENWRLRTPTSTQVKYEKFFQKYRYLE